MAVLHHEVRVVHTSSSDRPERTRFVVTVRVRTFCTRKRTGVLVSEKTVLEIMSNAKRSLQYRKDYYLMAPSIGEQKQPNSTDQSSTATLLKYCLNRARDMPVRSYHVPKTRMSANAQRDGRPVEYTWRPVLNAAKFVSRSLLKCRAVTIQKYESARLGGCKVNFAPGKIP